VRQLTLAGNPHDTFNSQKGLSAATIRRIWGRGMHYPAAAESGFLGSLHARKVPDLLQLWNEAQE
jgi:hypothetical protein